MSLAPTLLTTSMAKYFRPTARMALALFLVLGGLHVAAMLRLVAFSGFAVFLVFPLIAWGQVVMIAGFHGGTFVSKGPRLAPAQRMKAVREAMRHVPTGWKAFGLPFWYAYVPVVFFTRMLAVGGQVTREGNRLLLTDHGQILRELSSEEAFRIQADQLAALSAIFLAFVFVHFVCLTFVVPKRAQILAAIGATDEQRAP